MQVGNGADRDLEKKEKEEKDKLADEKRRKERKNRDRFKDMLRQHKDEGKLHFRSKWRVCSTCYVVSNF